MFLCLIYLLWEITDLACQISPKQTNSLIPRWRKYSLQDYALWHLHHILSLAVAQQEIPFKYENCEYLHFPESVKKASRVDTRKMPLWHSAAGQKQVPLAKHLLKNK